MKISKERSLESRVIGLMRLESSARTCSAKMRLVYKLPIEAEGTRGMQREERDDSGHPPLEQIVDSF